MSQQKKSHTKMSDPTIENKLKDLNLNKKNDINILLLGSTGVGKSTLINAFANYLTFSDLKRAKKEKLLILIPTTFTATDLNGIKHDINTGESDKNEYLKTGESATQDVKTYVFPIWNGQINIRLIDTPGMGDTRGINQDDINSENILSYIAKLHELHAICFLLKPNESRDTVFFNYCMKQILSRLDKSASDNIIFCFTNTRGADYSPGETISILKKMVDDIGSKPPYAKIPMNRNIFCFDNEPFRYLAAVQNNVEFSPDIKERNKESWEKSAAQCWKLIKYITGDKEVSPLKPHFVKSTNAVNEARRMINQLAQPLADITQLINQNISALNRHRENLEADRGSLEEMKQNLYMPLVTLEVIKMTQPATVCTARKCCEVYPVNGQNVMHYTQRCHDPCYLNNVPKEIIGAPELMHCAAMSGSTTCQQCRCDFRVHMHVYYMTKTKEGKEIDENMQKNIKNREQLMKSKEKIMDAIELKKRELDQEHSVIIETCAKFAHYLKNNAITPFNDAYKDYIEYLINREKSLGRYCDTETVNHLQKLLCQYIELKNRFDDALKSNKAIGREDVISTKDIQDSIEKLYKLKHNGKKIKELYMCQKDSRNKEHQNTEYLHKIPFKKDENKNKEKKDENKNKEKKDEKKNKEKKEKKDKEQENKDKNKSDNKSKNQTQRSRGRSPPPTYQEAHRQNPQNFHRSRPSQNGQRNNYPQGGAAPYSPNSYGPHGYPPQAGPHGYPPQPGPYGYPQQPSPYAYPSQLGPQGYPSRPGGPQEYPPKAIPDLHDLDINITLKKNPTEANAQYPYTPPNPNYPVPGYPQYPPYNYPSSSYVGQQHPPPLLPQGSGPYPPHPQGQSYNYHGGVNRQHSRDNQQGGSGFKGNDQGRQDFRGNKGKGGGVQKNKNRSKKGNKNEKNEEKKKNKKGKKSDSSDSSDSSSS